MKIYIDRPKTPPTQLYVNIISPKKENLGKGDRPVTFILPGGPGADHTVYHSYTYLKNITDLVFHDPRGCGKSDRSAASTYTMENYIEDVEEIRKQLSLNKIIIIGKSYGSICALGYALRYPHAVRKLVLAAGAPTYRFLTTAKKNLLQLGTKAQIEVSKKLWQGSFKDNNELAHYFQVMNTLYSVKARTEVNLSTYAAKASSFSYEVLNEGFKQSFWYFDYEKELQHLLCPTLILAGREDWINDVTYSQFMASHIPNSQLRVFDHASHAMETDVTDEYFKTIADFILN